MGVSSAAACATPHEMLEKITGNYDKETQHFESFFNYQCNEMEKCQIEIAGANDIGLSS